MFYAIYSIYLFRFACEKHDSNEKNQVSRSDSNNNALHKNTMSEGSEQHTVHMKG